MGNGCHCGFNLGGAHEHGLKTLAPCPIERPLLSLSSLQGEHSSKTPTFLILIVILIRIKIELFIQMEDIAPNLTRSNSSLGTGS